MTKKTEKIKPMTWRELNHVLATLDENTVLAMLDHERVHDKRVVVIQRLHQRYNTLRVSRERIELMNEVAGGR